MRTRSAASRARGEAVALAGVRSIIEENIAPLLIGQDPVANRSLLRTLWGQNFGNGMAIGGVSIALDDLRGKVLRIKGRGFTDRSGKRGDQLLNLEVSLPASDAELESFAERWNNDGNPRASLGV